MDCKTCKLPVDETKSGWIRTANIDTGETTSMEHDECEQKRARTEFARTGRLTTALMMDASMKIAWNDRDHGATTIDWEIKRAIERLEADVKRFETEVWFAGVDAMVVERELYGKQRVFPRTKGSMQTIIEDSPHRTLTDKLGGVTVTGQEIAGRALVQFETATARLTLIAAAGEQTARMGIQGIDGTEDECRDMLNVVRNGWKYLNMRKV